MANLNMMQVYDYGLSGGSVNREDLSDVIINIAPTETPLFSTAPRVSIKHTTHEWLEDNLTAASAAPYSSSATGYGIEGADFAAQALSVPARIQNWTQIFRKDIKVSETQRAVNPAGMRDAYTYEAEKALREIGRHIETKLLEAAYTSASGASDVYRTMKSLGVFLSAATSSGLGSAAVSAHNRVILDTVIEKCFIAGGNPTKLFCHPNSKTQFANNLSGVSLRNIAATDARVVGNIDVYMSNFNVIELIPDRFCPSGSATGSAASLGGVSGGRWYLLDQPKVKIGVLRPLKHVPIPPAGDAVRGMILTELTLVVEAPLGHQMAWNAITA